MIIFGKERHYIVHDTKSIKGFFGSYRFLSNFHVAPFWFEGRLYQSREHAYQAAKYKESERSIFDGITSAEAKKLGRLATIDKNEWDKRKYNVMAQVVLTQFASYPDLEKMLIDTGDKYLEESNHWRDSYWGVYYDESSIDGEGVGLNKLGKILMTVRELLLDK